MSAPPPPSSSEKNISTFIALVGMLFVAGGLIALITMVLPQFLLVVFVFLGFVLMIAFHYFTWGRWLSKQQPEEEESRE